VSNSKSTQAIHKVVDERKPAVITENLNSRGKAKSKQMPRLVTNWMRRRLKERLKFLAPVEGFHHKQVNLGSIRLKCVQRCLFVHKDNRKGDIFQCLNCGHTDYADRVDANNLLARLNDPDITLFTACGVS
jgi:transposase